MSILRQDVSASHPHSNAVFVNVYDLTPDINKWSYMFGLGGESDVKIEASDF